MSAGSVLTSSRLFGLVAGLLSGYLVGRLRPEPARLRSCATSRCQKAKRPPVQSSAGPGRAERSEPRSGALDGSAARSYAVSTVRGGGGPIACVGVPQGLSEAEDAPMCNVMVAWAGDGPAGDFAGQRVCVVAGVEVGDS